MKALFSIIFLLISACASSQSPQETIVLKLSNEIFHWETANKIDSLENIFAAQFTVTGSTGESQSKQQYLDRLRSGNFAHNTIEVEENAAVVVNNTATVTGKGKFTVTVNGNKIVLHLSYLEVFSRPSPEQTWKVLAMHAGSLKN